MALVFSYGTLQQEDVQLSTFGRLLQGQRDELLGFEQSLVRIEDPQLAAASGGTHHANVGIMQARNVRRFIWESSLGVGETRSQLGPLYNWLLIPLLLRHVFADKERQDAIIRATSLEWTIVQPAALTNGPRTGTYRVGTCAGRLFPRVSRADVAHFMIEELESPRHVRQVVSLCY